MVGLKKSLSCHRQLTDESGGICMDDEGQLGELNRRSSLDTFIIPGRTRYPSDETDTSVPTPIDLHIATTLLNQSRLEEEETRNENERQYRFLNHTEPFTSRYNRAAKRYGLSILDGSPKDDIDTTRTKGNIKHNAWSRIHHRLSRKSSLIHLPTRHTQSISAFQSLDDICRLGGVSVLHLSQGFSFSLLSVPTCIAVTANYLIEHGRGSSGVFRIPGQANVVNTLYDYYVSRIRCEDEGPDKVRTTVGSTDLPQALAVNVHDVASAFKRFLWDIPGGILGSILVFKTLKEIESLPQPRLHVDSLLKPRLIALVLLSLQSKRRFHLILAVFGLLALLKQDEDIHPPGSTPFQESSQENMSSKALGVVFAPVLLGNLTEGIELDILPITSRKSLLHYRKTPKRNVKTECSPEIKAGLDRTGFASNIIEFLLRNWKGIVQQLYRLKDSSSSSTSRFHNLSKSASQPAMTMTEHFHPILAHGTMPWMEQKPTPTRGDTSLSIPSFSHYSAARDNRTGSTESRTVSGSTQTFDVDGQCVPLLKRSNSLYPMVALRASEEGEGNLAWWERFSREKERSEGERAVVVKKSSYAVEEVRTGRGRDVQEITAIPASAQLGSGSVTTQADEENAASVNPVLEEGEENIVENDTSAVHDAPAQNRGNWQDEVVHMGTDSSFTTNDQESREPSQQGSVRKIDMHIQRQQLGVCQHDDPEATPAPQGSHSARRMNRRSPSMTPKPIVCREDFGSGTKMSERSKRRTDDSEASNTLTSTTSELPLNNETLFLELAHLSRPRHRISTLPVRPEGSIARHMNFRASSSSAPSRRDYPSESSDDFPWATANTVKLGTLFAEIRRLKGQLDARGEEVTQLRQELDAVRRVRDAGTLSEKVREGEREVRFWRGRAEWAERRLFGLGGSEG